jgi:hypothetical protein
MLAKVEAARIAAAAGAHLAIVAGAGHRPLSRFAADGVGTVFVAPEPHSARKAWLVARAHVAGRLQVDAGAARALAEGGSLLAAGHHRRARPLRPRRRGGRGRPGRRTVAAACRATTRMKSPASPASAAMRSPPFSATPPARR